MRCSLNLHLRSAHEKPQQPNRFDSPTDPDITKDCKEILMLSIIDAIALLLKPTRRKNGKKISACVDFFR